MKNKRFFRRPKIVNNSTIKSVVTYEAESIEQKVRRMLNNGEPINEQVNPIFTERKDGVLAGYNVRTDRFEIAVEGMAKVASSLVASREGKGKVIDLKTEVGGPESTQGEGVS